MSNIISAVSLKEPGKLSATYSPERAANMNRHHKLSEAEINCVRRGGCVDCKRCGSKMDLLTTHQHKRDELYCKRCDISIPLYE